MLYSNVHASFWTDCLREADTDLDEKALYLYLISSPHHNILGIYYLPRLYVIADLATDPERFSKAFAKLLAKGMIEYDEPQEIVFVKRFLIHNPIQNPNQVKAAIKQLDDLPDTPLLGSFFDTLSHHEDRMVEPLLERLAKRLGKPLPVKTSTSTSVSVSLTESTTHDCDEENKTMRRSMLQDLDRLMPGRMSSKTAQEIDYLVQDYGAERVDDCIQKMLVMDAQFTNPIAYLRGMLKPNGKAASAKPNYDPAVADDMPGGKNRPRI